MNKPDDSMTDPTLSGHPVPFNKPRTMPGGWDLSSQPIRQSSQTHSAQSDSLEWEESEEENSSLGSHLGQAQKFTQPRTIPKGWDTSVLK